MMRTFDVALNTPGTAPAVKSGQYAVGQTFILGALLTYDANGLFVECGADPTSLTGVAGQSVATGLGADAANSPTPTGYALQTATEVSVLLANTVSTFSGVIVDGSDNPIVPTQTLVNELRGVKKLSSGVWVIDNTETTTDVVRITGINADTRDPFVYFQFLPAVINA